MLITTKENIKQLLGSSATDSDALLAAIAPAVSRVVEKYLCREVEAKERTEYFDVDKGQRAFFVKAYPVTACAIYNDISRAFTTAIAAGDYTFLGDQGEVIVDLYNLDAGAKVLKIVYTGGLGASQTALQAAYPDIEMAARIQGAFWFERRNALGISSVGIAGQSITTNDKLRLLDTVKETLDQYRRKLYA